MGIDEIIYDESGFSSGAGIGSEDYGFSLEDHNLKVRKIDEIHKYGGEFYRNIINIGGGFGDIKDAYEGYEHRPKNLNEKLPNVTKIWNLPFENGGFMYGSSLGHSHPKADFEVQEIYEFLGYGAMIIGLNDRIKFLVCKPGDKVAVGQDCVMTILNLSYKTLETLDLANPNENESSKKILEEKKGPMIFLYHPGLNSGKCYCDNFLSARFSKLVEFSIGGYVKARFNRDYEQFGISMDVGFGFEISDNEDGLIGRICDKADLFRKYNVEVVKAGPRIECRGRDGKVYCLEDSLSKLAVGKEKILHKVFGMV